MSGLPEKLSLTVLPGKGIAFHDYDARRRLRELGFKQRTTSRRTSRRSTIVREVLESYNINSLDRYRELVGDERSPGPVRCYEPGATVLMERTVKPETPSIHYLILDTAIGCREAFLNEIISERLVRVQEVL
jgi:hypothetical protein